MQSEETKALKVLRAPQVRSFVLTFVFTLILTFTILSVFDLVPERITEASEAEIEVVGAVDETPKLDSDPLVEAYAVPVRIVADAVGLDVEVVNPLATSISALDSALLEGAVRYPGSGILSDNENMLIFGHSSSLPIVRNKAFQAFNGLKDLNEGDIIRVYSEEREYHYQVESVSHVNAEDTAIPLHTGEKRLTLSTCDSFGKKTDRYVVDASFVGSYPIET
jgi:LPXTG-site transpeptidase (sortase) family protein